MKDGIIELDSARGKKLGFTSDKFFGWLWKHDDYIYISFIVSFYQGQGNLSKLFQKIHELGYGIKVPTPFARMESILKSHGFKRTMEYSKDFNDKVEVWVLER